MSRPPERRPHIVMSVRDSRWLAGVQSLSGAVKKKEEEEKSKENVPRTWNFDEMMKTAEAEGKFEEEEGEDTHFCSSCGCNVPAGERIQLLEHYRTGWHRENARRLAKGKTPLTEEDWEDRDEEKASDSGDSSTSDNEDEREAALAMMTEGGARSYFVQDGTVYSAASALLREGEKSISTTPDFFTRPINCTIILLAGGHFAAGVFENDRLAFHRALHRYTVRAKQGGAQSMNDKSKGNAKSAGANLRRYNERILREEIKGLLTTEWLIPMAATPLIFIRCASYQRGIFISDEEGAPIRKGDPRIRTIPFETKRPLIEEVRRTWERLGEIKDHGTMEEFERALEERREQTTRRKTALSRKGRRDEIEGEDVMERVEEEEKEKEKKKEQRRERKDQEKKEEVQKKQEEDEFPLVDAPTRQSLYAAVRTNDAVDTAVNRVLEGLDRDVLKKAALAYMRTVQFPPTHNGFLHVATKMGLDQSIRYLLYLGCDPAVKNADGQVPYALAETRPIRAIFANFRAERENEDDEEEGGRIEWNKAQIPLPVERSEESLAKEAQRKKAKRDKQKAKLKTKKEEEKKEAEETAAKEAYLKLSDREKRALAAEQRLAAMERQSETARCFQCASAISGTPFEYAANRFCTTSCVAEHRAKGQPRVGPV